MCAFTMCNALWFLLPTSFHSIPFPRRYQSKCLWRLVVFLFSLVESWLCSPEEQAGALESPYHFWKQELPAVSYSLCVSKGLLDSSVGKESACNVGDLGLILGLGWSPGVGKGYPLQYSDLENSMDCMVHGVTKSWVDWATYTFTFSVSMWIPLDWFAYCVHPVSSSQ